jgi:adenylate cyclase
LETIKNMIDGNFAKSLAESKEVVIKMRFRIVILMILFFMAVEVFYFCYLTPVPLTGIAGLQRDAIGVLTIFCVFAVFEFLYRKVQLYYLEKNKGILGTDDNFIHPVEPLWVKLFVIFFEVSLPVLVATLQLNHRNFNQSIAAEITVTHIPFMILSMFYLRFDLCFFGACVVGLERLAFYLYYSGPTETDLWAIFYLMLSGTMMGAIANITRKVAELALRNSAERQRVQDIFGRFVSPNVAQKLVEKPITLGGDTMHACVMFMDIRDFTKRSATMPPEASVEFLNEIFAFSVEEVEKVGGIVNKFLGDGFMAVFGTPIPLPNPGEAAVLCALGILERLTVFNASRPGEKVELGFGINTGPLISGVVGTAQRREFTVIGDTVNMASRIEGLNKELGSSLLVSESVHQILPQKMKIRFQKVAGVHVKGKEEAFTVYRR